MLCISILPIIFVMCLKLEIFVCSDAVENDRLVKEELADFEDYLRHKHPSSDSRFGSEISIKRPRGEDDNVDSYREADRRRGDPGFDSPIINDNVRDSRQILPRKKKSSAAISSHPERSTSDVTSQQHHGVEEMVYFRRSDSAFNDPVPGMIEKLVNDQPTLDTEHRDEFEMADDANAISTCPVKNIASYQDLTCSNGPDYEIETHPAYPQALKHKMLEMLPEPDNSGENKCDPYRHFGPETSVEDRALCPFKRNITNRNPSRIPEYLYEAKCSCYVPNVPRGQLKGQQCVEVKRAIPVLWLVSCDNGKKRYKQGWEHIAVACAPKEQRIAHSVHQSDTT